MSATERSKRRTVPVRLSEIPVDVRLRAAQREARHARTPAERDSLIAAALAPSETVFYVTDDGELLQDAA